MMEQLSDKNNTSNADNDGLMDHYADPVHAR